uniref:Uncharacterized protein n=1 Tax=Anguilla anguilla TaxID=7936 RepID=A0A0E9TKM3_ANGAN
MSSWIGVGSPFSTVEFK